MTEVLFCSFLLVLCCACVYLLYWSYAFQKYQTSPSTRYELSDDTVLQCVLASDSEKKKLDSSLYQNVAVHTDLLPNVYEG